MPGSLVSYEEPFFQISCLSIFRDTAGYDRMLVESLRFLSDAPDEEYQQ